MSTELKLLQKAKDFNISRRNLMPTEYFQKAINSTIVEYKEIIFGVDSPICIEYLNELGK